ncbi:MULTISPECIES: helix-turn-helix domain-containing protein [unclassified Cryobacterium]|uniref:helix-turn-helix domain-containing protein n=1 Tax=unclassified Cryobacterium TaxID=2649013 RepID=UPI00141B34D7|nr:MULTISPECIES: helix-turn-helix transcriptional regulator [unclassified Cryobacterium]
MAGAAKKPAGPFVQEVAALLRAKIGREGLSHQQIATAVHISRAQISKILAGDKQIEMELLDEICWAIGQNFRELVTSADKATEFRYLNPEWDVPTLVKH